MSSSGSAGDQRRSQRRPAAADAHLGDRLAAFVDGELSGDTRDRVAAHLATCQQCKAAAAEQRRLKSVVAGSELPAISAGLLARLQGLPGMDCGEGPGGAGGQGRRGAGGHEGGAGHRRGPFDGGFLGRGGLASRSGPPAPDDAGLPDIPDPLLAGAALAAGRGAGFSYLGPAADLVPDLVPDLVQGEAERGRGFRVHDTASRGRRFAFAAAGAVSMAAIAIGSTLPMEAAMDGGARPDDGPAVSPVTAGQISDTRGAYPRGVLESVGSEDAVRRQPPAVAASATSMDLAGALLTGRVTPLAAAQGAASQIVEAPPGPRPSAASSGDSAPR